MKKITKIIYLITIICICLQSLFIIGNTRGNTSFMNSFWNTLGYGLHSGLDDWSEAGKVDFSILNFTGTLYIKNDYSDVYIGVLIVGKIANNITWRINFDIDADGEWAEDAKALILRGAPNNLVFTYEDEYYLQNNPQAFPDSAPDNFIASTRNFSLHGFDYSIFELKIPLLTDDYLHDLQVQDPETTTIGLSIDVFNLDTTQNGTWRGETYPNFAKTSNYLQILFAGPQDRKTPQFDQPTPPTTTTEWKPPGTTEEDTKYPPVAAGAATSFEGWIALLGIGVTVLMVGKGHRRKKR